MRHGWGAFQSINPATGETIQTYPGHDDSEIAARLDRAGTAFTTWRATTLTDRAERLTATAAVLRADAPRLAGLMTEEMGKPIAAAEAEVEKCAWVCEHYAAHAASYLAPETIATDAARSGIVYEPLGAVLAVMPWNFPFWQVFRCAAPALAAGNVVVLKHASNVPGSALAIEDVFRRGGIPDGVFTTLLVGSDAVSDLIAHPVVRAVSVTGSEAAGAAIATRAGTAIKKVVLELGGSDPFVVLADVDPEKVARDAAAARTINNGQSCIAAKRFIVAEPIAERFEVALAQRMKALVVGDPADRRTDIGPLARADLVGELHRQVEASVARGARLLAGGRPLPGPGFYYPPTVLADVTPGMAAFDEETFGPLAAVTRARDDEHAIALANTSAYGLGASVWTADSARGEAVARRIEAGAVFVNGTVKSDPRLPFGGIKRSGYGRELAAAGIREFVNLKTIWVR